MVGIIFQPWLRSWWRGEGDKGGGSYTRATNKILDPAPARG